MVKSKFCVNMASSNRSKKGLRVRNSPTCTLSQNGYGDVIKTTFVHLAAEAEPNAAASTSFASGKKEIQSMRPYARNFCPTQFTKRENMGATHDRPGVAGVIARLAVDSHSPMDLLDRP